MQLYYNFSLKSISTLYKPLELFLKNTLNKNKYLLNRPSIRNYSAPPKRFYQRVNILKSDGKYEITLDQRRLKTPKGAILQVENEALALAVATEWDSQKDVIQRNHMHLTALSSTVIDNPNNNTKYDIVQQIISYLDTDTVLFYSKEEAGLYQLQQKEWQPLIDWFCERYQVTIAATESIGSAYVSPETIAALQRHLLSYNFAAIHGFLFAVEALKSAILTSACVERRLNVSNAVLLSRLEEEYQCGHWGRVEWAHDLSQLDLQARVAAAVLFVHLNSASEQFCGHWGRVEWAHDLSQLDLQARVAAAVLFVHLNSASEQLVTKKNVANS